MTILGFMPEAFAGPEKSSDARWQRAQEKLREAVLELATEKAVASVSVTEVAERAGVDRTTFYKHAVDPESLLVSILRSEMMDVLTEFESTYRDFKPDEAFIMGIRMIVGHVYSRREIYSRSSIHESNTPLSLVVRVHVREHTPTYIRNGLINFPEDLAHDESAIATASRFIAAGFVGALTEWLSQSNDPSVDGFMELFERITPSWYRGRSS